MVTRAAFVSLAASAKGAEVRRGAMPEPGRTLATEEELGGGAGNGSGSAEFADFGAPAEFVASPQAPSLSAASVSSFCLGKRDGCQNKFIS